MLLISLLDLSSKTLFQITNHFTIERAAVQSIKDWYLTNGLSRSAILTGMVFIRWNRTVGHMLCTSAFPITFSISREGKQPKLPAKSGITRWHALVSIIRRSQKSPFRSWNGQCEYASVVHWCWKLAEEFQSLQLKFPLRSLSGRRKKRLNITLILL